MLSGRGEALTIGDAGGARGGLVTQLMTTRNGEALSGRCEAPTIGVCVQSGVPRMHATLAALRANSGRAFRLVLLPDGPDEEMIVKLRGCGSRSCRRRTRELSEAVKRERRRADPSAQETTASWKRWSSERTSWRRSSAFSIKRPRISVAS